ncbi:hypothetical protein EJ06DRAFT_39839 [Trichodelitschia bisporula]|uniref:Uncharacterized protein n=1 Tax=Trichodelitschia bisporula TaxID=703511 RepID=A0A6G1HVA0_9PEZI|nr:hypothetical protein EJ06DRAFT_39839 [Trichodelitschia bisporula]
MIVGMHRRLTDCVSSGVRHQGASPSESSRPTRTSAIGRCARPALTPFCPWPPRSQPLPYPYRAIQPPTPSIEPKRVAVHRDDKAHPNFHNSISLLLKATWQ